MKPTITLAGVNLHALCSTSPDTAPAPADLVCGGGIDQPAWRACSQPGVWLIRRYQHAYCTKHAAIRLHTWHSLGGIP